MNRLHDGRLARHARGCAMALATLLTAGAAAADPIGNGDVAPDLEQSQEQPFDFSTPLSMPPSPASEAGVSKFKPKASSSDWEAKLGVDNRPALKDAELRPERFLQGAAPEISEGVAWANVTGPGFIISDKTTFETRLDPDQQSKLGMTLSRSIPLGSTLSMTWQNGYSVTQSHVGSPPVGLPTNPELHTPAPMPGQPPAAQVFDSNQVVRFTILPADTTVSLGATISSANDKWMRSMSAEQKLFGGPVSVTGVVEEKPGGEFSKALKAGFKRTW